PPPLPEPIPPPEPVPFDGGPETLDMGSPRLGIFTVGNFTCGGITTVGSTGSFGASLRTTTAGGVICSIESLGSLPLGACNLSRSPPPPPPPMVCGFLGGMGKGGVSSGAISSTVCLGFSVTTLAPQTERAINPATIKIWTTNETLALCFL